MTKIILVRHGETETNQNQRLHQTDDTQGLNDRGREQIEKTAAKIKMYAPAVIYSSPEKRAVQTAQIIGRVCGLAVRILAGIRERNWGKLSGKPWSEIQSILDKMSLDERFNYAPSNGESWKEFEQRLISALDEVVNRHQGKTIVMVSHAGAIRALIPHLLQIPREESFRYDPANASLSIFEYDGRRYKKILLNDVSHLED